MTILQLKPQVLDELREASNFGLLCFCLFHSNKMCVIFIASCVWVKRLTFIYRDDVRVAEG